MGIDGVGKPGAPPGPVDGIEGPGATQGEGFRVEEGDEANAATGSEALQQLERGELGLTEYLDVRVAEATRHLEGTLSPQQLEFVKESLKEQLATDPVLVQLVRRTTGSSPA
jgi:hypothetical protein